MDEIEQRLRETSENCFNCYEAWQKDKKDVPTRESLQESIHELRKVASRLEIEVAISERDQMTQKPIPIPPHRASKRRGPDDAPDHDDGPQPGNNDSSPSRPKMERKPRRRSSGGGDKKASSGNS